MLNNFQKLRKSFLGAVIFYTAFPLPPHWQVDLQRIVRWGALIGLLIGCGLGLIDGALAGFGIPGLTRSALIVALWVFLTGGLHLDGVIDTADGLAVTNPQRRLEVMQDSVTGAFGVMAAILVLLLKTLALSDLASERGLSLMLAAGWGRWGQVAAIAFYPYLKPTGKGAFHKQTLILPEDLLLGLACLLLVGGVAILFHLYSGFVAMAIATWGLGISLLTGFWFYRRLGGQTGDTYGAMVEWTEALFLCVLSSFF